MFPSEFILNSLGNIHFNGIKTPSELFISSESLEDAFWLAEKVGLFNNFYLQKTYETNNWTIFQDDYNGGTIIKSGETIPEVICKAILEIYGKKE